jgi:hypothetical protein
MRRESLLAAQNFEPLDPGGHTNEEIPFAVSIAGSGERICRRAVNADDDTE